MLEPPLADEGLAPRLALPPRRSVDHVVVVGSDLLMQPFRRMRQQVAVLVDRAALHRYAVPHGGDCAIEPGRAVPDEELGPPQAAPDEIVNPRPPGSGALAAQCLAP